MVSGMVSVAAEQLQVAPVSVMGEDRNYLRLHQDGGNNYGVTPVSVMGEDRNRVWERGSTACGTLHPSP